MVRDRALVFPGLIPLSPSNARSIVSVQDHLLDLAARVCGFDPVETVAEYGSDLPQTFHEALLAVAVIRRTEEAPRWSAFGGLSAGCLPALHAAGALSGEDCFHLIHEINTRQIRAGERERRGTTLSVLTSSEGDAVQLLDVLREQGHSPHLSVDLGDGLVAIARPASAPEGVAVLLNRLGVMVLDEGDRAEHCPHALPGREEFAAILETVEFRTPWASLFSPVTGERVHPSPAAMKQMLVDQWYDTASLPKLLRGMCDTKGVRGVDLVSPEKSVYVTRMRDLLMTRSDHRLLALPG